MDAPNTLSATEAARHIREGRLSSVDLVKACLARIDETDGEIKAWVYVDSDGALDMAEAMDNIRKSGRAIGPLHGVPVGLKDIIDTKDMPTQRGTPIFDGRQPDADAAVVERLREAGAVILGKTVTTELAFVHANETRNPHNTDRSPGGSSSGSAAAVAEFHVPLAIGSQTNGSVVRPASFCGIYGFKPTRGMISRRGVLETSQSLDQIGCFGRTLGDVALLADAISNYDPADSLSFARHRPDMLAGAQADVPVEPSLVWFDMPYDNLLTSDAAEGFAAIRDILGSRVEVLECSPNLSDLVDVQHTIHEYEICQHQSEIFANHWDQISASLQPVIERGRKISAEQYQDALGVMASAETFFDELFLDFDAVIAPSAIGEAPIFGQGTGDPIFSTIWTLGGLPSVTLPVLVGGTGLPIGMQMIGSREIDDRLLRTAKWVLKELQAKG
jgi:Asp-tRNA(Asn)/Glu-tRNA(Gln) amidotransferase A subunit family amidase